MNDISVSSVLLRLLFAGLIVLFGTAFSIAFPAIRDAVFDEDRIVEWMTVIAFATACVLGARKVRRKARSDVLLIAVTILAGLAVLDELSFGERILGWEAPYVLGTKLDAVHDLFRIGQKTIKRYSDTPYLIAGAIGLALCLLAALFIARLRRRGWVLFLGPEAMLIGVAVLFLALAQGIDINLRIIAAGTLEPLYVEEVLELAAGMLFLSFVDLRRTAGRSRP